MLAQITYRPARPVLTLLTEALALLRTAWRCLFRPADATGDSSIDWEDGESR